MASKNISSVKTHIHRGEDVDLAGMMRGEIFEVISVSEARANKRGSDFFYQPGLFLSMNASQAFLSRTDGYGVTFGFLQEKKLRKNHFLSFPFITCLAPLPLLFRSDHCAIGQDNGTPPRFFPDTKIWTFSQEREKDSNYVLIYVLRMHTHFISRHQGYF